MISQPSPPSNLPLQLTSLVGRDREVPVVSELLCRDNVRLLTLTGPPGIGKTRLGIQVATNLLADFADGIYFINLAPISDPGLVVPAIAQILGVRQAGDQPLLYGLKRFLFGRQILLLLDNFEQVVPAGPSAAELLLAAPGLRMLVTSREVLHLSGEYDYPVPPLSLPPLLIPDRASRTLAPPPIEQLIEYAAVQLFVQRAVAVKPDFTLAGDDVISVAEICRRLDGLPLAIELAAARIRHLPPQAILDRLQRRLQLLTGGAQNVPARHQTLRAAIEWSHSLLNEPEQRLFRRLAVFRGGCTLEAIEAICNTDGDLGLELFDGVASLLDKSLLKQEAGLGREPRLVMLETVREHGLEKLAESGEEVAIRLRYSLYYLAMAERAEQELRKRDQEEWLARLEADHDNMRAVLRWTLVKNEVEIALRLAGALAWFWYIRGHWSEGREWLHSALSRDNPDSPLALRPSTARVRTRALIGAGLLATWSISDLPAARSLLEESLAIARELGDRELTAYALFRLAQVASFQQDYDQKRSLLEESLAEARRIGDKWLLAGVLAGLVSERIREGGHEAGRLFLEESLALRREIGDKRGLSTTLINMGERAREQGDYAGALSLYEEASAVLSASGDTSGEAIIRSNMGFVFYRLGKYEETETGFRAALALWRRLNAPGGCVLAMIGLAGAAIGKGPHPAGAMRAARLIGAAEATLEKIGDFLEPIDRADHDAIVTDIRTQLDEATWQKCYAEGEAITLEEAVAYAEAALVSEEYGAGPQPLSSREAAKLQFGGLTKREREVAALIAQGKSNQEIADQMVVSERTIEWHVSNILSKLGFHSRSQVSAWVVERNLTGRTN